MSDFPEAFIDSIRSAKGFDEEKFFAAHHQDNLVTSIRINPSKCKESGLAALSFAVTGKIPWTSGGYYLGERPSFTTDPFWHAGVYYVQEASSMFLEEVVKQSIDCSQRLRVLDICAAPGGKTTLLQSMLSPDSLLVSNEVIKPRVYVLSENITKWGAANVVVTNNDPEDFGALENWFDMIVVDAPCSGSGLFRKDPGAMLEWSLNNVDLCVQRQKRILSNVIPALKPGGVLIYSTCSYSEAENESLLDWLMDSEAGNFSSIEMQGTAEFGIVEVQSAKKGASGYRFYPDKLKGEGFFIAALRKHGEWQIRTNQKVKSSKVSVAPPAILQDWLAEPGAWHYLQQQDLLLAVPESIANDVQFLQEKLYLRKAGVEIGTVIRNELIPSHALALSNLPRPGLAAVEIDLDDALQYLRRADWQVEIEGKGWILVKYKGVVLGWIKAMQGRVNNYYPREWRILNK